MHLVVTIHNDTELAVIPAPSLRICMVGLLCYATLCLHCSVIVV